MNEETTNTDNKLQADIEKERIGNRRAKLKIERHEHPRHWGIALSGGGIRSATFALGVLQAMARAPAPTRDSSIPPELGSYLLPHFDYLSTVSGGGYIGSFFTSMFVPGRLTGNPPPPQQSPLAHEQAHQNSAKNAYATLRFEPPGRIHTHWDYSKKIGEAPMAWLRENGRYLLPSGSGDFFYVFALTLRNMLSVQFVIGMPLLLMLSLLAMLRLFVTSSICMPYTYLKGDFAVLFCNSLWWLPTLWLLLGAVPLMIAFWMVYSIKNQEEKIKVINKCTIIMTLACMGFAGVFWWVSLPSSLSFVFSLSALEIAIALLMFLTIVFFRHQCPECGTYNGTENSVRNYRVRVTRILSRQLIAVLAMVFIAGVTDLTELVYDHLSNPWAGVAVTTPPVLIVLVRVLTRLLDDKALPVWVTKLPTEIFTGAVGFTILLLITVLWGLLVAWVRDDVSLVNGADHTAYYGLTILAVAALILGAFSGSFIGFINLSSLQAFYSGRLARTYLGASNGQRFRSDGGIHSKKLRLSATEAMEGDDLQLDQYYASDCAPIHLINVTMNLTMDPAENLVQRDRKGKPLCIAPGKVVSDGLSEICFILDGDVRRRRSCDTQRSELNQPLTVAHWIATSGAALTTGLGRATSLATSMSLGLANVRLGTWWPCNFETNEPARLNSRKLFGTQNYLFDEFTARFHGLQREYQYLSDGGHFENTAAYELIRANRDMELIVLCDSGCDLGYQFDDLANLTRLARIDQSLEIEVDTDIPKHPILGPLFGDLSHFTPSRETDQRCALLLNVFKKDGQRDLQSRILVLKPRVIAGVPADVRNYAQQNPTFPNESTADQFFNEAQFESYRQLGLNIGQLLFGDIEANVSPITQALWDYLWPDEKDFSG